MRILLAIGAVGLFISGPALAENGKNSDTRKASPDKIVCKTEEFVGSMIPRRICMKRSDWDQGAVAAKDALDRRRLPVDSISLAGKQGG
jgi:hypothetical protein